MIEETSSKPVYVTAILLVALGIAAPGWARPLSPQGMLAQAAQPQLPPASANVPDDVQLVGANGTPTIRIPVAHSSLNWTLIRPRIRASYGWLEIDRGSVRYNLARSSRVTKEADQGFAFSRTELADLKMEYGTAEFRASGLRHFFGYSPPNHWDAADSTDTSVNSVGRADGIYNPIIMRALQSFDSVVAELNLRQQARTPAPVVVPPEPPAAVKPPAPATPPTLVLMTPSGVSENQTVDVTEPTLTIRGVAMDDSGLPTITINGAPAALRPKNEKVAEFWSDPISLQPGANRFEIEATSAAKATSHFQFVAQFTPKTSPVDPRALDKADIVSLLQGGVPDSHVRELVKNRGIKFTPASSDLNDIRAAGGSEELVLAIQQAAVAK